MLSIGVSAAVLCLLSALGVVVLARPALAGEACAGGYSWRAVWQDLRSVISFVLGALLTSCVGGDFSADGGDEDAEEESPTQLMDKLLFVSSFL